LKVPRSLCDGTFSLEDWSY